jgi:hypothetical protein
MFDQLGDEQLKLVKKIKGVRSFELLGGKTVRIFPAWL